MISRNNPGNIRRVQGHPWVGEIIPSPWEPGFVVFQDLPSGYRALVKLLQTYMDKYSLRTIRSILYRWAPPAENDTESYIRFVSQVTGISPEQQLSSQDSRALGLLAFAISDFEHTGAVSAADVQALNQGLAMALQGHSPAPQEAAVSPWIVFAALIAWILYQEKKQPTM